MGGLVPRPLRRARGRRLSREAWKALGESWKPTPPGWRWFFTLMDLAADPTRSPTVDAPPDLPRRIIDDARAWWPISSPTPGASMPRWAGRP